MKKVLLLFCLGICPQLLLAQTFEGIVRWTMTMEIKDPEMRAKMAEAQRQMNDPATQQQLKEMEAKMNDPEMKKMMEQNPQMKAAMENAMKSAKGPGGMNDMMPKGMIIKVKGMNIATVMEGGMADGMEILHMKDQPPVRINRKDMTYSKMPSGPPQGTQTPEITVNKTTETMKILGYNCTKYIVNVKVEGKDVMQTMWTTTEIKDIDLKALARQGGRGQGPMFSDKVEGVPLRMEMASPQGNMVMEVAEIKKQTLSDAEFSIPAGFKEVKGMGY